jgi:hypothetical protein
MFASSGCGRSSFDDFLQWRPVRARDGAPERVQQAHSKQDDWYYEKDAGAGGSFLLSSLQQYGCDGAVGKAVESAIASNCTQSETRASLCFAVLEALLAHIAQGGVAVATKCSFVSDRDLLLQFRWKLSVDIPFNIPLLQVVCNKLARTLVHRLCWGCVTQEMKMLALHARHTCASFTSCFCCN